MSEDRNKNREANMKLIEDAMKTHAAIAQGSALEHAEPIDFTSVSGVNYKGTVVFKRASTTDIMRMGGLKSEFLRLGGAVNINLVDDSIKYLAHVMSTLQVVIVRCPEWLKDITAVVDTDVLYEVHDRYVDWSNSFRVNVPKTDALDSETAAREEALDTP